MDMGLLNYQRSLWRLIMSNILDSNIKIHCSGAALSILSNLNSSDSDKERLEFVTGELLSLANSIAEEAVKLTSVNDKMPPDGQYVLTRRKSGYTGAKFEFISAKYMKDYKGWTDIGNSRLTDSGENPTHWRHFIHGEMQELEVANLAKIVDSTYSF